jgi:hypothetical protein
MEPLRPSALVLAATLVLVASWYPAGWGQTTSGGSDAASRFARASGGAHDERVRHKLTHAHRSAGHSPLQLRRTAEAAAPRWRGARWLTRRGFRGDASCRAGGTGCPTVAPRDEPRRPPPSQPPQTDRPASPAKANALTPTADASAAAPAPPAQGEAHPALGTQFQCNWTFYTDAARVAVLDKLRAAGVEWVRIDTGWSGIEAARKGDRNAWYLRMVDFCVDEAHKRGLKVLVTLWLTPGWANGGRSDKAPPTNPQDYADFARWAASHWKGRVAAWQVWNEPDPGQPYFAGTLAEYVALLKAAYPAFKAGDPNALVVLGGPSSNDDGWISQLYALGAKGSFDVLATHPYQGIADAPPEHPDDGNRWWFTHLPAVRQVMLRHGDGAKPIWFTEFGWSAHSNWPGIANWQRGVSPEQQGEYLLRAIRYTKANYPYVPVMFWYKERANPLSSDPHYEGYALLNADLSERPVYRALKAFLNSR